MPLYDYECPECHKRVEVQHPAPTEECPFEMYAPHCDCIRYRVTVMEHIITKMPTSITKEIRKEVKDD